MKPFFIVLFSLAGLLFLIWFFMKFIFKGLYGDRSIFRMINDKFMEDYSHKEPLTILQNEKETIFAKNRKRKLEYDG